MSKHTSGPWAVEPDATYSHRKRCEDWRNIRAGRHYVVSVDRFDTYPAGCDERETHCGVLIAEADARRIVACVNACVGISTETMESGVLDEIRRELRVFRAVAQSMPAPKLGEWNWPDISAQLDVLLAKIGVEI